jgi:hypothetical protein
MTSKMTLAALAATLALCLPAQAGTVTFSTATDAGVGPAGPFPNTSALEQSFLASLQAPVTTHGFGSQPAPSFNPVYTFFNGDGTFTINPGTPNLGNGVSGMSNIYLGAPTFGYSVGGQNNNWFGVPQGSTTFNLTDPTTSLGFYITGHDGADQSFISFTDTDNQLHTIILPASGPTGGANYLAISDTSPFQSFTIRDLSDPFGLDRFSFNTAAVPGPIVGAGIPGLLAALGMIGLARRRRAAAA